MGDIEPKTTRELLIYIKGEISELKTEISNIRKITFWMGGLAGAVASAIVTIILTAII
jgi:hypothetical protein